MDISQKELFEIAARTLNPDDFQFFTFKNGYKKMRIQTLFYN